MVFLVALGILITISLFLLLNFKFKMEEAMFTSMSLIVIVLTIFGIFGIMNVGQYLIYILALASFIYVLYYLMKVKWKFDYTTMITPGFVVTLLSFIMYMIVTKNNVLYIWDEASCYGTAAHYMDVTNTISNGGSVTVFTYFFTTLAGYSEHALFISRWLFMWICVVLPLSTIKWDKWYMAVIYAIFVFGVITLIDPEPKYLMDAPAGIIAGAGIAYLSILRKKTRTTVLALTCVLTITLKDNIGLILFAFMSIFYVSYFSVELSKRKWKLTKKDITNIGIFIICIISTLLMKPLILPINSKTVTDMVKEYLPIIIAISVGIVAIIILWFAWFHKIFKKYIIDKVQQSQKIKKNIIIISLSLTPLILFAIFYKLIWQILYELNMEMQKDFVYSFNQYFGRQYFGFPLSSLALILLIVTVFCTITIITKKYKASFVAQSLSIISMIIIYGFILSILFIKDYYIFLKNFDMMGIERFIGSLIIMICVWLMAIVFSTNDYWVNEKKQYIAAIAVSLLLIRCMPLPGETMFSIINNSNMIANKNSIRPMILEHATIVKENTPEDATILIIDFNDENSTDTIISERAWQYWMHYEIVPRPFPAIVTTAKKGLDKEDMTIEELEEIINKYEYVYIGYANNEFYLSYGELFATNDKYKTKALYKCSDDATQSLKLVFAQKDK